MVVNRVALAMDDINDKINYTEDARARNYYNNDHDD